MDKLDGVIKLTMDEFKDKLSDDNKDLFDEIIVIFVKKLKENLKK